MNRGPSAMRTTLEIGRLGEVGPDLFFPLSPQRADDSAWQTTGDCPALHPFVMDLWRLRAA